MILSGSEILQRIEDGELEFTPDIDEFQLQQHSVDLRLGFSFLIPKRWKMTNEGRVALTTDHLDFSESDQRFTLVELEPGQVFEILPGEYTAVATLEKIALPADLMAILYPRSSVNRRGLSIDLTGIVDAGFEGKLLIPVRNNTRSQMIRMYPGERFCQLVFEEINGNSGLRKSRWHNKDVVVMIRQERSESETIHVRDGKIEELKRKYSLLSQAE